MCKKLIILILSAMLLAGCGASEPAETAPADEEIVLDTTQSRAETGIPAEEVPESTAVTNDINTPDAEYFVFKRVSDTVDYEDGTTMLYENYCQVDFHSDHPEHTAFVNGVLNEITRNFALDSENLKTYANDYLSEFGTEGFYAYSNYQDLGISRCDDQMVSLISLSSLYAGGAHPNSVQVAYNLDIPNNRVLKLEDMILEDGAERLTQMVLETINAKFAPLGEGALFSDYVQTIETSLIWGQMTPYWYCNSEGLVIFYNQYELGTYAAGIINAELPYEELEGILNPNYLTSQSEQGPGGLVLRGDWDGYRRIPISIAPEGSTILVGVEGTISQVRLSEVLWLEDTPITHRILFAAASLGQSDVLEITGITEEENRSYAVEFITDQGEERIIHIHEDHLSDEP